METSTNSRRPILKKNVEAFVPSPRFLSESPARQPSSGKPTPHISSSGQPLPQSTFSPSPSIRQLRSPVPPPPANLFAGNASAFNVDPGIPFLATVGPSDAGNSDRGSINENENEPTKRFVGGFVTGLKKALTIKGSRRKSSNYQQPAEDIYSPPMMIRDSGYAVSNRPEDPPANYPPANQPAYQPPLPTTFSPSPPRALPQDLLLATSKSPPNNIQAINNDQNDAPAAAPHDILSLDSMASAVTAAVGYGPDYAKMGRPTPPHSDVTLTTYMVRAQNFVRDLVALPWIANERVTVDYYPAVAERRDKRSSHRPAFVWRSQDYNRDDYHLDFESESSSLKKTPHHHVRGPSRTSHTDIDLDAEFPDQTYTPLPYHPPIPTNLSDTLPLYPPNNGPMPEMSQAPRSGLQLDRNLALSKTPPARRNPTLVPRSTPPSTLPVLPQDFGQIPNTYSEDLHPGPQNNANLASKTPPVRKPSLAQRGDPQPSSVTGQMWSHSRTRSNGQRPGSRNDVDRTSSNTSPIRHRPASVQSSSNTTGDPSPTNPRSSRRRESTPKPEPAPVYSGSPKLIPQTPSNRPPGPGSPSKRCHRSHTPNRQPHHNESTEEWDQYRPGYVPFEYSENYYGTRYGVGIHGLLPPVMRVPSAASTALSIKQPQPQYPVSTLMTPPSRSGSSSRALDA